MSQRLHFDDFRAGQTFSLGEHRISAEEMIEFAAQFDPQPQHLDREAAKASILGGLAASGWYLCALCMRMIVDGLFSRCASMGAPGVEEVQWRKPVYAGDLLQLDGEVLGSRQSSRPDRGYVQWRFSLWRANPAGDRARVMMFVSTVIIGRNPSG
jgi:acyl dehydratase